VLTFFICERYVAVGIEELTASLARGGIEVAGFQELPLKFGVI
jgi:hypothetical protein